MSAPDLPDGSPDTTGNPAVRMQTRLASFASASFMLLCGMLFGGAASAQPGMHDTGHGGSHGGHGGHGGEHAIQLPVTPVREVALPEGVSSAQSIAVDPAGRVWFTEKVGKKLVMYDPDQKTFTTHSLPASWGGIGFSNMTMGSDGEIWFTVTRWVEDTQEPNILGRFSPADGYFTKYAIPHHTVPEELIVDAAGTIWFFASNKNFLYRVDGKTFALKGYSLPAADGSPKGLAADRNGHIWFSESNANKLGRFDPEQGVFHEYEVLTPFANPGEISVDAQGKIWFVEVTANRIGAFSPESKRFDEAIIPTPSSSPVALAHDDAGNVWFLEYKGNKVGVFDPKRAAFREYDIPGYGSLPADMAIDRKRALIWFTQSATEAKKLGVISITDALAESGKPAPQPPSAANASHEALFKWLILLALLAGIAKLGAWLYHRSRKGGKP